MWSRGHVLGGRVTAATRLCFPYFAMRWGFARPRVRGDRRDLTTGMSGGADVGLPRLGLSGNGNTGWGRHICWLYPLCDVETPPARRQGQATVLLDAESGMRLGRVPLPQCASLCRSASRIASRPRQPARSLVSSRGAPSRPRRDHWSTTNRLHGRIPNRPSAARHGNDGRQGSGASSTCRRPVLARVRCLGHGTVGMWRREADHLHSALGKTSNA